MLYHFLSRRRPDLDVATAVTEPANYTQDPLPSASRLRITDSDDAVALAMAMEGGGLELIRELEGRSE
jgi:hypothetical protein